MIDKRSPSSSRRGASATRDTHRARVARERLAARGGAPTTFESPLLAVALACVIAGVACQRESPRCDCVPGAVDGGTKAVDGGTKAVDSGTKADATADADPSTGMPECDAYIAYFKACNVMIAGWTPASAQAAADVMIKEYIVAGATAGGKAMTAANCVTEMAAFKKFASASCPDVK